MDKRSVGWVLTCNNYDDSHIELFINNPRFTYACYGEEVGASGTRHLQCYARTKSATTHDVMKRSFPGFWMEPSKSKDPLKAINYCKGDCEGKELNSVFVEKGQLPGNNKSGGEMTGQSNADKWSNTRKKAKEGNFEEIDDQHFVQYYGAISRISAAYKPLPSNLNSVCGIWYYGVTGTGKSHAARMEFPEAYMKLPNKWWDGYNGQQYVILDDLDMKHDYLCYNLKIWADKYAFNAEVKGSYVVARPVKFIVTSNYHPNQIWTNESDLAPLLRRFKVTRFCALGKKISPSFDEEIRNAYDPDKKESEAFIDFDIMDSMFDFK